jgi:excisionase family DNA binding protein
MAMSKQRLKAVPQQEEDQLVVIPRRWMTEVSEALQQILLRPMAQAPAPPPLPATDGWLTRLEVAALTKFSAKTVRRWVRLGRLKCYRPPLSTGVRFKLAEVEALMSESRNREGAEDRELAEARARLHEK